MPAGIQSIKIWLLVGEGENSMLPAMTEEGRRDSWPGETSSKYLWNSYERRFGMFLSVAGTVQPVLWKAFLKLV